MSCILRVGGQELDVGALLKQLPFMPYRTWCKGDVHGIKKRILTDSGAAFDVSQADLDEFDQQTEDATAFLEKRGGPRNSDSGVRWKPRRRRDQKDEQGEEEAVCG